MKLNQNASTNILIIGLGVIGGSYAKALTKRGYTVYTITKEQTSIDYAKEHGFIYEGYTYPDPEAVKKANLIVFALYPHDFIEWIKNYQHLFKAGSLITDVTGVKASIVYKIQDMLRPDVEFIPAHPMAGRERSGVEYSDEKVFEGANYIITPTEKNSDEAIEICRELGYELGFSRVSVLSPEKHDEMIAFLSQLTHCIAVSLMTCKDSEHLVEYTGDSFRDLTRIAQINDLMWSELFMENKENLLEQMDIFEKEFSKLHNMLKNGDVDGMRQMMRLSSTRRSLFNKK